MDGSPDQDDVPSDATRDVDADDGKVDLTQRPWTRRERWSLFFARLFGDRQGDTYSSISPRKPDGTRTRLFFFNGNGQSR